MHIDAPDMVAADYWLYLAKRYPMRNIGRGENCDVILAVISYMVLYWWLFKLWIHCLLSKLSAVDHEGLHYQH